MKGMQKIRLIIFLFSLTVVFGCFYAIPANASTNINSCQNLNAANEVYVLTANVSSAGTCFAVGADNITLDGQGYWVNYSQSATGYAINNSLGYNFTTIKNLNIAQSIASIGGKHAIYMKDSTNGAIINNTFNIASDDPSYSYVIYLYGSTLFNLSGNTIVSGAYNYGIRLDSSGANTLSNNNITTSGDYSRGIRLDSSGANTLSNNTITTSGYYGYGIYLTSSSNYNTLSNNSISTSGDSGLGIYIVSSGANALSNNTITTSGSYGYGVSLSSSSTNNISSNIISTSGYKGHGIRLSSSGNSSITGNAMSTASGTAIYFYGTTVSHFSHTISGNTEYGEPIYYYFGNSSLVIENRSDIGEIIVVNSTNITIRNMTMNKDGIIFGFVLNSTIENSSLTTADNGVSLTTSNYASIANNTITASDGYGIYLYSSSVSNTISNNNITSSDDGITLDTSCVSNTISSNIITTSGYYGYGIYLWSS
ncbi:MAG: right-handed parallel beta-helix repeat-containing protein, partial [Nanoarchaeota archaeon]|nr:right-handed parallel beta-helix repeat-containing protein [Nanoarchaeota archaeon]